MPNFIDFFFCYKIIQKYNNKKRLERLFLLLETGQSTFLRKSAAFQIGEIVKTHPNELGQLLEKVSQQQTYYSFFLIINLFILFVFRVRKAQTIGDKFVMGDANRSRTHGRIHNEESQRDRTHERVLFRDRVDGRNIIIIIR